MELEAGASTTPMLPPRRQQLVEEYTQASHRAFEEMAKYEDATDIARDARQRDDLRVAVRQWDNASHALAAGLQHRLHELALRQQEYSLFKTSMQYDEKLKTKLIMGYCERRIQRVQHFEQDFTRIKGAIAHLDHKIQQYNEEALALHDVILQEDLHNRVASHGGLAQILSFDNPWPTDPDQPERRLPVTHNHGRYYARRLQDCEREKDKFIRWGDEKAAQKAELMEIWERKRAKYRTWSAKCQEYDEEALDVCAGRPSRRARSSSRSGTLAWPVASPAPHYASAQDRVRGLRRMYGASTPIPLRTGNVSQSQLIPGQAAPSRRSGSTGSETVRPISVGADTMTRTSGAQRQPSSGRRDRSESVVPGFDEALNILDDQTDFEAARARFEAVSLSDRNTPALTVASASGSGSIPSNVDSGYGASGSSDPARADLRWLTGDNERREGSTHKSWHDAWERTKSERRTAYAASEPTIKEEDDVTHGWEYDYIAEENRLAGVE